MKTYKRVKDLLQSDIDSGMSLRAVCRKVDLHPNTVGSYLEGRAEAEVHVAIYPAMQKWFTVNKRPSGWVFPNPATGEPWTSFKRSLATASKKVGASIDHHDFRRRSGQNAYEASGHDVFAAQRHLRHKDIRTTMRYLGIDDQRRNDINKSMVVHVDKLLKAAKPTNKPIRKPRKTDS